MTRLPTSIWWIAVAKLALHLVSSSGGYGFFSDEFYYLACADHLDWGYVDHPPLSIWILAAWKLVLGDSLAMLRLFPALVGSAAVVLAAVLARELGGGAAAQRMTAIVVALAPVNLVIHGYYSMNAIDMLVWEAAFIAVAYALRTQERSSWIALGALLGFGLLNKLSLLWFGLGLGLGLLATPYRRVLFSPGPWIAVSLAGLLFAPHVIWQVAHDWPTLEFVRAATTQKMVAVPPLDLFSQQLIVWNPLVAPLWIVGFVLLLVRPASDPGRIFAIIFATTAAILIANGTSRPNYLALAFPPLIAAGAIFVERQSLRPRLHWLAGAATALIGVVGLAAAPLTVPLLSVEDLVEYSSAIQLSAPKMENRKRGAVDPHFADMMGWESIVDAASGAYDSLSESEKARATVLAPSYSIAGAIDRFGPSRGLPSAIGTQNNYWLWGTGGVDGSVVVIVGGPIELWTPHWNRIEASEPWDCGHCLPGRNHGRVYIARDLRGSFEELWLELRHYN